MSSPTPDFYLASNESMAFRGPRQCWVEDVVEGDLRSDYLLVRIYPTAKDYETGGAIDHVVVAGRDKPTELSELPLNVYIAKITNRSVFESKRCDANSIEVVATGDIYSSENEAAQSLDDI